MEYRLKSGERIINVSVEKTGSGEFNMNLEGAVHRVSYRPVTDNYIFFEIDGVSRRAFISEESGVKTIAIDGRYYEIADADKFEQASAGRKSSRKAPTEVTPPMPAVVVKILVEEGSAVKKGDGVVVVSAMKMETTLTAPYDGIVKKINTTAGSKVMPGDILADIEKTDA